MSWQCFLALVLIAAGAVDANFVTKLLQRARRQYADAYGQTDASLANDYWNAPVSMGVFVQEAMVSADVAPFKRSESPLHPGGSGSGSGSGADEFPESAKRDKVPGKPKDSFKALVGKAKSGVQLSKKSELFAVSNSSTTTADDVEVEGEEEKAKVKETVTCEGEKEWIQCPTYHLIKIHSAFWGRDKDKPCSRTNVAHGLKTDKMCAQDEANTMAKVQNACDGENACELVASQLYFDRTDCSDVYKYLRLNWECAKSESRIKESLEREHIPAAGDERAVL